MNTSSRRVKPADSITCRALATNACPELIWRNLEYDSECDGAAFRLGVACEDLSAFNKSQVGVELLLKDRLVPDTVGPVEVVANREDDMTGLPVDTQNIHHVGLFDGHWLF